MFRNSCLIAACCLITATLSAQSYPSAEGRGASVWVGAEISTFNPDYGCLKSSPFSCWNHQLLGIAPYVDANHLLFQRVGAEGEARFLHWRGPGSLTEASYMTGPRVGIWQYRQVALSGKFLVGLGRMTLPTGTAGSGNYLAYAPGVVVDYRLAKRVAARVDYEYQMWPSFKGSLTGSGHGGLTPNGLSIGVSYALMR